MSKSTSPIYDIVNQSEDWRNEVAAQLNEIVNRVEYIEADPLPDALDREFCAAARSIVERVASFEEIKTVAELNPKRP